MIRKGFIINTSTHNIDYECEYDDTRIDGMYVKCLYNGRKEIIPAAYVFPIENKRAIEMLLIQLATAKKNYDDIVADVYYKQFPKLR